MADTVFVLVCWMALSAAVYTAVEHAAGRYRGHRRDRNDRRYARSHRYPGTP